MKVQYVFEKYIGKVQLWFWTEIVSRVSVIHVLNVVWFVRGQVRARAECLHWDLSWGKRERWQELARFRDYTPLCLWFFCFEICFIHWWMTGDVSSDVTRLTHWGQEATQTRSRLSAVAQFSRQTPGLGSGSARAAQAGPGLLAPALVPGRTRRTQAATGTAWSLKGNTTFKSTIHFIKVLYEMCKI